MSLKKILSAIAVAGAFAASGSAFAYPTFTVDPSGYSSLTSFQADKITGNYEEVISLNLDGTFDFSLKWNAGQYSSNNGGTALDGEFETGLGFAYNMYALFQGSGTYTLNPDNTISSFTLTSGGGLELWIDPKDTAATLTKFVAPATGAGAYTLTGNSDDIKIATGTGISGAANFAKVGDFNSGSFGQTTSFALTADGKDYFVAPNPFYSLSFESGQINFGAVVNGPLTTTINGSLDVIFQKVPEPSSLPLVGAALVGLGVALRRRKVTQA